MPVRIVEGQLPYTGGTGIGIDANKVISLLLREENNLIMVNDNNEVYTDLQLESGLTPSSDFPVGVTVGKVLQADGWTKSGLVLNRKTTSGDYARWIYATDGEIYFDNGTGTWKQVYYSSEVDALFAQLRSELATVAFTGDYDDLINKPVDNTMYGSSWDGETEKAPSQNAVYDKINSIDSLISTNATSTNKLMDKNYIDDGINSVTAYYITKNAQGDQFATHAELASATTFYSGGVVRVPTRNDYTIVLDDETHNDEVTRYIYNNGWEYQYTINESPMTQAQLNALNSGITSAKVSQYDGYATSKANDSEVVKLSGNQTIAGTKTFSTSPVVPSKTTAATNSGTKIATEAQVYKKQDTLVSGTNIKTINSNSLLGSGNLTLNDVKVSSTAPSSPTEGMVWYDTTNDELKVYNGSQWNVTGKEYNAGEGIEIGTIQDYSAMQGPAPYGFHVPLNTEWQAVKDIWTALGGGSSDGTNFGIALKLPFAGYRYYSSADVTNQGISGYYWSSSRGSTNSAYDLSFGSTVLIPLNADYRVFGSSVRCFKDTPTIPTSSWTKLYGTSIESGGIFWSSTDGLISLSSDGTNWITIADKNLGATTVWNSGDTLSEANCGKYYQRGNNYGFPFTGSVTTSSTQVDASTYGPGNYYSSSTFITRSSSPYRWDSTDNGNLWGGETGVVTLDNAITNTGVLSVNGQTGDVTIPTPEESNTKTFYLSSTSDLTTAQAAYDWYAAGKNPIIVYQKSVYVLASWTSTQLVFYKAGTFNTDYSTASNITNPSLTLTISSSTVSNITAFGGTIASYLATNIDYSTPYTPTYNGSPATKKYVDDRTPPVQIVSSLPASPTAGTIYFVTD